MNMILSFSLLLIPLVFLYNQNLNDLIKSWFLAKKGQILLNELAQIRHLLKQGRLLSSPSLTPYKSFHHLADFLTSLKRSVGGDILGSWNVLLKALKEDVQAQRKLEDWKNQGLLQISVMNSMIWGFIFLFLFNLDIPVVKMKFVLIIIGLWQGLGLIVFILYFFNSIKFIEKSSLPILECLMKLDCLSFSGLSSQQILNHSNWWKIKDIKNKEWSIFLVSAAQGLDNWQKNGNGLKDLIVDLKDEFWFVYEDQAKILERRSKVAQVAIAIIFILPSFFFFTLGALSTFLV